MFQRRKERNLQENFREAIWPKMGWLRVMRYYGLRIYRLDDTPYAIAAGFASGVALSFTPFVGFHLILSLALARILNGSLLAALVGTIAGNPWTFPFIWLMIYKVGMYILGVAGAQTLPQGFEFALIFEHPGRLLLPMIIGAIPCGVLVWAITYYTTRDLVIGFQRQRQRRRARARLKEIRKREAAAGLAAADIMTATEHNGDYAADDSAIVRNSHLNDKYITKDEE
ncbi:MAG: DUF2062 domain-containing protein [Pseudomonadota bacterium]